MTNYEETNKVMAIEETVSERIDRMLAEIKADVAELDAKFEKSAKLNVHDCMDNNVSSERMREHMNETMCLASKDATRGCQEVEKTNEICMNNLMQNM